MFGRMKREEELMRMAKTMESAMRDLNIIFQFPDIIKNVEYDNGDGDGVFDKENTTKILKLSITFDDKSGKVSNEKKRLIEDDERELLEELDKLKREKEKYERKD